jgi:hypothetical protein
MAKKWPKSTILASSGSSGRGSGGGGSSIPGGGASTTPGGGGGGIWAMAEDMAMQIKLKARMNLVIGSPSV